MKPLPYFKETIPIYNMNLKQNIIYENDWK